MLDGPVEVHFLTKRAFVDAVEGLPGVTRTWAIDRTTAEVEEGLQGVGFHYVVDLHANARSGFVKRALRKGEGRTFDLTVDKRSLDKILLVQTSWDRLGGQHVVERYLGTLKPFGDALERLRRAGDEGALALPPSAPTAKEPVEVVLALGAAHEGKAIPEDHWSAVVAGLLEDGRRVHLIGGPAERNLADRLKEFAGDRWSTDAVSLGRRRLPCCPRRPCWWPATPGPCTPALPCRYPWWSCGAALPLRWAWGLGGRIRPRLSYSRKILSGAARAAGSETGAVTHTSIRRVSPQRILVAARHILGQTAP